MTTHPEPWLPPPADLTLGDRDVHLWCTRLSRDAAAYRVLERCLSPDERQRADRFHFERDRKRYVAARGVLRNILGCYLKRQAREIRFCYGTHGKPALDQHCDALRFNLAHSQELAVYAVTRGREVGVDVEFVRRTLSWQEMARHCLTAREQGALFSLADGHRRAFLTAWTRKEAYLKAVGVGLSLSPSQVEVTLRPEKPAALLAVQGKPDEASHWELKELSLPVDYVGAVAVETADSPLRFAFYCVDAAVN